MSWHFWIWPLVVFWFFGFRRNWGRSERSRERYQRNLPMETRDPEMVNELEAQRGTIAVMEERIAELENRLDFTERLLAGRREPATDG